MFRKLGGEMRLAKVGPVISGQAGREIFYVEKLARQQALFILQKVSSTPVQHTWLCTCGAAALSTLLTPATLISHLPGSPCGWPVEV